MKDWINRLMVVTDDGQAIVEAVIVLPILILMFWGIWHLHDTAFYSARAAMAARHGAWILSMDEGASAAAAQAVLDVFHERKNAVVNQNPDILLTYSVSNNNSLDTTSSTAADAARSFFNTGAGGFIKAFIDSIPIFQPFTRNILATVIFQVDTPLTNFEKSGDGPEFKVSGKTYGAQAYFATRIERLYFHNSWDFFKGGIGSSELGQAMEQADSGMEDAAEDFEDASDSIDDDDLYGEHDGSIYTFDDYKEALDKWRQWMRSRK